MDVLLTLLPGNVQSISQSTTTKTAILSDHVQSLSQVMEGQGGNI